jgi:hypothetical protein
VRDQSKPYTAEFAITAVKTRADGTTITQESTEVIARDARGRTLTSITTVPAAGNDSPATKFRVFDPVNRVNSNWDSVSSVARVVKRPSPTPGGASCWIETPDNASRGSNAGGPSTIKANPVVSPPTGLTAVINKNSTPPHVKTTVEYLGTETIDGWTARGSRVTQTTSSDATGNDEPSVSTRESWQANANGIGLTIREIDDDPQNGKRTTELVKFSLGEPDPATFQPPQGYETATEEMREVPCKAPATPPLQ